MALKTRVVASFRDVGPCPDPFLRVSLPFALFLEEEEIDRERERALCRRRLRCGAVVSSHRFAPTLVYHGQHRQDLYGGQWRRSSETEGKWREDSFFNAQKTQKQKRPNVKNKRRKRAKQLDILYRMFSQFKSINSTERFLPICLFLSPSAGSEWFSNV